MRIKNESINSPITLNQLCTNSCYTDHNCDHFRSEFKRNKNLADAQQDPYYFFDMGMGEFEYLNHLWAYTEINFNDSSTVELGDDMIIFDGHDKVLVKSVSRPALQAWSISSGLIMETHEIRDFVFTHDFNGEVGTTYYEHDYGMDFDMTTQSVHTYRVVVDLDTVEVFVGIKNIETLEVNEFKIIHFNIV